MSRSEQTECRAILLRETPLAIQVQHPKDQTKTWWIPRSQIGYLRKTKDADVVHVTFTLAEWLVENKQLWELVP